MDACRTKFVCLFGNLCLRDAGRTGRWITGRDAFHWQGERLRDQTSVKTAIHTSTLWALNIPILAWWSNQTAREQPLSHYF